MCSSDSRITRPDDTPEAMVHTAGVIIHERVDRPFPAFRDRSQAGRELARNIDAPKSGACLVLGLPRGGIPVGEALADKLAAPLEPVFARKLPLPLSPEMGFGAIALDGTVSLNERVVAAFGLGREEIDAIARDVVAEVRRRAREYSGNECPPEVEDRYVYMIDDGLATGQSMIAAARMVRKRKPARLTLCVPVAPVSSIDAVRPDFDEIHCLLAQRSGSFAVASYYADFHEMSDDEVRAILDRARHRVSSDRGPTLG
jgi:putative phosphoribosyl transferase